MTEDRVAQFKAWLSDDGGDLLGDGKLQEDLRALPASDREGISGMIELVVTRLQGIKDAVAED